MKWIMVAAFLRVHEIQQEIVIVGITSHVFLVPQDYKWSHFTPIQKGVHALGQLSRDQNRGF